MKPDIIIVTVLWDFDSIADELKKKFVGADIYSLEEVIGEIGISQVEH